MVKLCQWSPQWLASLLRYPRFLLWRCPPTAWSEDQPRNQVWKLKKMEKNQIQKYLIRFKKNLNVQYLEISYATTSARYFGSALTFTSISSRSTCGSFDISSTWLWDQKWKVKEFGILMQAIIWKTKKITKKENKHNTQKHKWVKRYFD
jgi:hypothetical protein